MIARRVSIGAGLGLVVLAGVLLGAGSPQDKPLKIGIVNVKDCFDDKACLRVKDLQKELNDLKDKYQKELEDMKKQAQTLESQMRDLPPESELFKRKRKERAEIMGAMKVKEEIGKLEIQEFWRKSRGRIYEEMCKAAETVAKTKGLNLVLKDDAPGPNETEEEKAQIPADMKIVYRAVLYYDPGLDITKDVLASMNDAYTQEKNKVPNPNGGNK
jgi:Skp family chaperone for outer membrane proteins